ncbi:MAG TPA: type II secretion system F family protein [Microvirga sp.]|jgi:tight adherence protein B
MIDSQIAAIALAAIAAGGVAYALLYPLISGNAQAEKRQQALVAPPTDRRERVNAVDRREQVSQSLKELEARQKAKNKLTLETRIAQAGLQWTRRSFYLFSTGAGLVLALTTFVITQNPWVALGSLFAGGLGAPRWLLGHLTKRRINRFVLELPNAIDVIVRGIRSGLPLNDCMRIVATEAREPLKSEFRIVMESHAVGMSVPEALEKLYERVPVSEANFFAIVITIQQKAGGNLSEALGNLSRVLRERRKMGDKIKAMSMEAKASAAIIAALPVVVAVLTYLTSPGYISLLWTTQTGKFALAVGGVWMLMGVLVIKKMISFKI